MKEIAERENRHCIVEGTDKYCMQGLSMPNALNAVNSAIVNACNLQAKDKTIILDVCNERFNAADVFGVNLSSWNIQKIYVNLDRTMLRQYLAWSLCNVLRRGENDSFLNPPKSSVATCIKIHLRKAKNLFGQNTQELVSENTTLQKALSILEKDANAYQMMLDQNRDKFKAVF